MLTKKSKSQLTALNTLFISNILVYSTAHAVVDAACAAVIFQNKGSIYGGIQYFAFLVILYDVLAFALQPIFGFIIDRLYIPAFSAAAGCIITAFSILAYKLPVVSICLAGLGNALFHVGGGIAVINLNPGKAAAPGIYVAPGALGLTMGTLLGASGYFKGWPLMALLAAVAVFIALIRQPEAECNMKAAISSKYFGHILILILTAVIIRSLIGSVLNFPWKSNYYWILGLALAVSFGKGVGGVMADRFGWTRVVAFGTIISAFLLSFGRYYPLPSIMGILLFNMTMPVTLAAAAKIFPGNPGFAFGLTTLALIVGAFPSFTNISRILNNSWIILIIILSSSYILYRGLGLLIKNYADESKDNEAESI